jgi:hypothetical protein
VYIRVVVRGVWRTRHTTTATAPILPTGSDTGQLPAYERTFYAARTGVTRSLRPGGGRAPRRRAARCDSISEACDTRPNRCEGDLAVTVRTIGESRCPRCLVELVGDDRCGPIYCWHCGHQVGRDLALRQVLIAINVALLVLGAVLGAVVDRFLL